MKNSRGNFPIVRLRRLRSLAAIRNLVRETQLDVHDLILPLFIRFGTNIKKPIASMPGHFQWSTDRLEEEIAGILKLGIKSIILFGIPEKKDEFGAAAYDDAGVIQTAIRKIKQLSAGLLVISDVCFCEYTDHGHCGIVTKYSHDFEVDNDSTLDLLAKQAVSHAKAGADIIAPSTLLLSLWTRSYQRIAVAALCYLYAITTGFLFTSSSWIGTSMRFCRVQRKTT